MEREPDPFSKNEDLSKPENFIEGDFKNEMNEAEDKAVAKYKEVSGEALKTLSEIKNNNPDLLKIGKIIYGFPQEAPLYEIADKFKIDLNNLAKSGLIEKINNGGDFFYSRKEEFSDAYKNPEFNAVSLKEAQSSPDFFDTEGSYKLEKMKSYATSVGKSGYEKYGNSHGQKSNENDEFRLRYLVEEISDSSSRSEILRERLGSQLIEFVNNEMSEKEKPRDLQEYQELLKSLFAKNFDRGTMVPMLRHWIDPYRSTIVERIIAAQVIMHPDFSEHMFENFGSDTKSSIWCKTLAPYLYKALSEKGIKGKEALERINKWSIAKSPNAEYKREKILPGIDAENDKPFALSDNPNGPTHVYAQQKAEELVKEGLV